MAFFRGNVGTAAAVSSLMMKLWILLFSISGFFPSVVFADQIDFCVKYSLAVRTASENCWLSYALSDAGADLKDSRLCIPKALWLRGDRRLCGKWSGDWVVRSRLVNTPADGDKKRELIFRASAFPVGRRGGLNSALVFVENAREKISSLLASGDRHGFLRRLILDERGGSGAVGGFIRQLGFVHVLVASGIHLYALADLADKGVRFFGGSLAFSRVFGAIVWLFAWVLSGARAGMVRPLVVVFARSCATAAGLRWRIAAPLALALSVDLLWSAFASAPGRWHYALAVGGGLAGLELVGRNRNVFFQHAGMAVGSWLFTALLDVWDTGVVALATPFLSLVSIPLVASVIYPLSFIGLLLQWQGLLDWLGRIWDQVVVVGSLLAMKFQTVWFVPRWAFALGIVIALLMVFLRVRRLVLLLVCFMAVGVSLIFPAGTSQRVVQLDVGQGDSALVSEGARHGLIDSGAQGALTPDAWLRLFAFYGVRKLDWLALTHMDADHAGGVAMLLALLPIGCLELPVSLGDESLGLERELRTMAVRYRVRVVGNGDGCFPYATRMFHGNERSNADMAVFSIPFVDGAVYLNMGDAGGETELAAVSWFKRKYPAAKLLWKLSHHGARASSSDEVIRTLFPVGVTGEAWVSVGAGNRYGHPSFEVLKRVDRLNIQLRRTDREGALVYSGLCCVNR